MINELSCMLNELSCMLNELSCMLNELSCMLNELSLMTIHLSLITNSAFLNERLFIPFGLFVAAWLFRLTDWFHIPLFLFMYDRTYEIIVRNFQDQVGHLARLGDIVAWIVKLV